MSATMSIAWLEVRKRRWVPLVGAALGVVAGVALWASRTVRAAYGVLLSPLLFAVILTAILLGFFSFGPEMGERRIGFFLARPISTTRIWAEKMLGACLVATLSAALALLPWLLVYGWRLRSMGPFYHQATFVEIDAAAPFVLLAAIVSAVALGAILGIAGRAASRWLFLDLAAGFAVYLAFSFIAARIEEDRARIVLRYYEDANWVSRARFLDSRADAIVWVAVAALGVAVVASSFAGFALGRADVVRGHRSASKVLWGALLSTSLGCVLYTIFGLGVAS